MDMNLAARHLNIFGSYAVDNFTLAAAAGVQSCFPVAQDTLTVEANTLYRFEGQYLINTGATTHTTAMAFLLAGGATVAFMEYVVDIHSAVVNTITTTGVGRVHVTGVASKVLNATSTAVWTIIYFNGSMRTTLGGTITPQIAFSANPTGTNIMKAGSFIEFRKMGMGTTTKVGAWT
jgi:hypothetical protein